MNARINITTPAGKSLEGFPIHIVCKDNAHVSEVLSDYWTIIEQHNLSDPNLHKGDTITIEIL